MEWGAKSFSHHDGVVAVVLIDSELDENIIQHVPLCLDTAMLGWLSRDQKDRDIPSRQSSIGRPPPKDF